MKKIIIFAILGIVLASCSGRRTSSVEPSGDTVEVNITSTQENPEDAGFEIQTADTIN